ncbi:MAG: aminotransferase class I/II-fold pyridoxal phosphate-dependent enzyme [Candidatus Rokubacteria bacterium]|nr:aminotransferase class I/II-fold pyridoxal phosphate-dependent enzyme [Candidatus Rokubacteria bacterium]
MEEFHRIKRLPPYVFAVVNDLKVKARARGEDIIDLGMGNPDLPTPRHIVDKLCEAARNPRNHRYSASRGIARLRVAITHWYRERHGVELDPETEAIVTIGAKEGLAHLALAVLAPGDGALVPNPTYPIHAYSVVLADGDLRSVPLVPGEEFFVRLEEAARMSWPKARLLLLSFPHNPTTQVVDRAFFERVVAFAREHRLLVVHDFAYADLCFDGYRAPSFLEVPGAKEVGVEFFSLSKSYNMPGWRLAFACGNPRVIHALGRIKSYLDYGVFQPVQIAAIIALEGNQACVGETVEVYRRRRDTLVNGLGRLGWPVEKPRGTMFVWAPIPEAYRGMGSLEFAKLLLAEAKVAVSPGIGFGEFGEGHVRFALVENEHRTRQALRGIRGLFARGAP